MNSYGTEHQISMNVEVKLYGDLDVEFYLLKVFYKNRYGLSIQIREVQAVGNKIHLSVG